MKGLGCVSFGQIEKAVEEAGAMVREGASSLRILSHGEGLHPTTSLDKEVDKFLHKRLLEAFRNPSEVAYLSEEEADDLRRLEMETVLIVDPIDGTRSLLKGLEEVAVSVALWHSGALVFGIVFNPFTQEKFVAERGGGACLWEQKIRVSEVLRLDEAELVMSRTELETGRLDWLMGKVRFRPVGSIAYKMCLVAAGRACGTFTPGMRHEWDMAAATVILEEAGGQVTDGKGREIAFNSPTAEVRGLVASNGPLHTLLLDLVRQSPWGL